MKPAPPVMSAFTRGCVLLKCVDGRRYVVVSGVELWMQRQRQDLPGGARGNGGMAAA